MTLYSANVLEMAKPVDKKGKGKKAAAAVEDPVVDAPVAAEPKAKRQASEAQIAALKKGQETRKRKREEAMAAKKAEDDAIEAKKGELADAEKQLADKKAAMAEKRRLAREAKKNLGVQTPATSVAGEIDEAVEALAVKEPKAKKVKGAKKVVASETKDEPPQWFQKYVEGVKSEEARVGGEKKPKKEMKEEAKLHAGAAWNDGLTRNRVQQEVNNHQDRMFSMIFAGRRMK